MKLEQLKLLTWFDIRRVIRKKTRNGHSLPEGIVRINCFSDAVEIGIIVQEKEHLVQEKLKEWFGDWYEADNSVLKLDVGDADLPVEITVEDKFYDPTEKDFRPFWEEITYASNFSDDELDQIQEPLINLPEPYQSERKIPQIVSFYSFKGGVGRTLHLVAYVLALVEEAKKVNKPLKILVIDSDLEAPGITYWQRLEQKAAISFMDFLEVYHYSPVSQEESMNFIVKEIQKSVKQEGISKIYTLPACLDDDELLDISILPEHLVKNIDGVWEFSNALYKLGSAMDIDYIFVDLRSGLSEISSPILFDPRVQRFLVTTINDQSINGTSLVLKQLSYAAPLEQDVKNNTYCDPIVLISFLTPELKSISNFQDALVTLQSSYINSSEKSDYETRLDIKETDFSQNLLYVNGWQEAKSKLADTTIMKVAREWAKNQAVIIDLPIDFPQTEIPFKELKYDDKLDIVKKLRDVCQKYIYAESGQSDDLLITESLKNLALTFQTDLPHVVSIGSKGSGKTFNYIQLSRLQCWHKFLQKVLNNPIESSHQKTYIYPLLQSISIKGNGQNIIDEARNKIQEQLEDNSLVFSNEDCKDKIAKALKNESWDKLDWTQFWLKEIADSIGLKIKEDEEYHVSKIDQFFKDKSLKIIFLFDGIEDIFQEVSTNDSQKKAIQSLISIPQRFAEIRNSHVGIIIFIRRDFVNYVIEQNLGQFESLYRDFDLSWNSDSFLRLVYWIFLQANIPIIQNVDIDSLEKQDFIKELNKVWGKKIALVTSSEAITAEWIFAALTDFKGRLQARDIVRFLYYTAHKTVENSEEVEFDVWSSSVSSKNIRLLPPKSIRYAIEPCSDQKIQEAQEEYPDFKKWFENLPTDPNILRIPFDTEKLEKLNIDKKMFKILEEMGVIYENKDKDNISRYYIPEIFRSGLKFILDKGGRPSVIALKRKTLGKNIL